ncbi:MAG: valine--tRNA ligase [Phycisphaerae bacterium]
MTEELSSQYQPVEVENRIYKKWLDRTGGFHAVAGDKPVDQRFSMVIPPPNVTGALHLGHAINATIQDILARYHRMAGHDTLWMPGIDHAGIATQAVVEKTIFEKEKLNRHDLGRDELVKRIWEWKEKFGNRILDQLKAVGASCDWPRSRFTLDDQCAAAVREAFFRLFKDGLIFRGLRLVNWDTHLQTAVADDEIYHETVMGQMTSIRYPINDRRDGDLEYLVVATTRPETMLGDTAVAVHPDDPRYQHLIGRHVIVPLVGRKIPIIADGLLVDPKFGTGVVKVTPAHDPNDYATGQRHNLPQINLLTPDGKTNSSGKGEFRGQPYNYEGLKFSTEARKRVLEDLESLSLIEEKKPHEHEVGHSDRSKTPIEPYLSEQWFVKMGDVEGGITLADGTKSSGLAQAAIDAVISGRVKIVPERYAQGYIDWLSQKRDWCISRQLWWGHRIPVWTMQRISSNPAVITDAQREVLLRHGILAESIMSESNTPMLVIAARDNHAEQTIRGALKWIRETVLRVFSNESNQAAQFPGVETHKVANIIQQVWRPIPGSEVQDPDVLDTWFSSALWPLSTMGWPKNGTSDKPEDQLLPYFYPTSVLSTAREILTLWVARMVMFGLYCHGDVPFKQVYIHAVIQDGNGKPMKKSLGNGVDPVDIVESHGADALRFTLASMATETQDIRLPVVKDKESGKNTSPRFDAGRNFANKIWNASRFILSNIELTTVPTLDEMIQISDGKFLEDRWILSRLNDTVARVVGTGEQKGLIEECKFADVCSTLYSFFWNDLCDWYLEIAKSRIRQKDQRVQRILLYVLRGSLALLHPVMPFVTEAIWEKLPGSSDLLMLTAFPEGEPRLDYPEAEAKIQTIQQITRAIRDIRNQYNVDLKRILETTIHTGTTDAAVISGGVDIIESLANAKLVAIGPDAQKPANAATAVVGTMRIFVTGVIDRDAELARLQKRRQNLDKQIASSNAKLGNSAFINKAPPNVVQGLREQLQRQEAEMAAVQNSLMELKER